jgi:hypothetical protein
MVYSAVATQFDGDDEVLLKTISNTYGSTAFFSTFKSSLLQYRQTYTETTGHIPFSSYTSNADVTKSIMGFEYEGKTFYIQIYVPFVENVNPNTRPVIVVGTDDDDTCEAPGYQVSESGKVTVINVTEEFAKENLTWVVSVNERVLPSGQVDAAIATDRNGVWKKSARISQVNVSDDKECWLNGESEISFVGAQTDIPCNNLQTLSGLNFICIKGCELNTWCSPTTSNSGLSYLAGTPTNTFLPIPLEPSRYIDIVVFEKDVSKKKWAREFQIPDCTGSPNTILTYYSKQTPYGTKSFSASSFPVTTGIETETDEYSLTGMKFKIKYRHYPE